MSSSPPSAAPADICSERGFTLLEVLIALAILGTAVVLSIQGVSQGLRLLKVAGDQQQAIIVADQKAREVLVPVEGTDSGADGRFSWERTSRVLEAPELTPVDAAPDWRVFQISVVVTWDAQRRLEVSTLRTVPATSDPTRAGEPFAPQAGGASASSSSSSSASSSSSSGSSSLSKPSGASGASGSSRSSGFVGLVGLVRIVGLVEFGTVYREPDPGRRILMRAVWPRPACPGPGPFRRQSDRPEGFTLVELIIALAIVATLVVVAFGGLRVVLGATQRSEARIEVHQHVRSLTTILKRSLGAAYPYKGSLGELPEQRLLFRGQASTLEFVTQAPPFPLGATIAYTAVVLSHVTGEGLVIRERALPNREPFAEAAVVLRDPAVTSLAFRYLDDSNSWQTEWEDEDRPPTAIEITLGLTINGRAETVPPMVVPFRIGVE